MRFAVYLPLLFPLLAAPVARPLADRLEPRLATWVLTAAGLTLATAGTSVLGLLAFTGLIRIPPIARLAHLSPAAFGPGDLAESALALGAGLLLVAITLAVGRFLYRRVRAVFAAVLEAACFPGDDPLVVLDEPGADAFAMPGLPGRIVVSTSMLATLDATERDILLAHERAHLRGHHYLFSLAAQLAAVANPLLRPLADQITYTVERWADEAAVAATGDRRRVAVTVGKAALASKRAGSRRQLPAAAFGLLGRVRRRDRLSAAGPVPRRVAALLAPPPVLRAWQAAVAAAVLAAVALCVLEAVHDLHEVLELAKGG